MVPEHQRGIYRSTDGGATFQRVLYKDANTGAFSVAIDPNHPDTVYATLWSARQAPWEIGSSFEIPQSGLYKSIDGGTTWNPLTTGLPAKFGRASVAVAPSDSNVVYLYADSYADGGDGGSLYRSDDAGAHFAKGSDYAGIAERGDDLATVTVDPKDAQTVYISDTSAYRSTDGGRTVTAFKGAPGGDDYQAIWINPNHPDDILLGVDQGATLSLNRGRTWSSWYNQPTAQMYHVSADDRFPYRVCGGQQESGSACVLSRGDWGQINERDWHTAGAEEYGYVIPDPLHAGVFFGGKVERFDEASGQAQEVSPIVFRSKDRRVVRTEPLAFDPIGKRTLYFGANVVSPPRTAARVGNRSAPTSPARIRRYRPSSHRSRRPTAAARIAASSTRFAPVVRASRHDLGRHRRRAGLGHPQWWLTLDEHHAGVADAVEQDRADRRLALRRSDGLYRRQPLPPGRSTGARLSHPRRRRELARYRCWATARPGQRDPAGSARRWTSVRGDRERRLRLVRRR